MKPKTLIKTTLSSKTSMKEQFIFERRALLNRKNFHQNKIRHLMNLNEKKNRFIRQDSKIKKLTFIF